MQFCFNYLWNERVGSYVFQKDYHVRRQFGIDIFASYQQDTNDIKFEEKA